MLSSDERYPPGGFRELVHVALPLVFSSGTAALMQVTDRIFLTWYRTDALAAAMPAGMLHWTVVALLIGTAMYVNTFVAQYDGAGRKDRVVASLWQGLYLSIAGGLCLILVLPFSESIFALIGHAPEVQALESQYFSILCLGTAPLAVSTVMSCFYSGRGLTRTVMCVNLASVAVNAVLAGCLVFGIGPFPEMGIRGAALATVLAETSGVAIYASLLYRARTRDGYHIFEHWRFDRELTSRMIRYGLPTGLQFLADVAGFSLFIFLVGRIGTRELAATNLAFNLNSLAFIPMFGIGTAVMTLVGRRIGEARPELAVRTAWMAFAFVGTYMILFAAIYLFLPDLILFPYAANSSPAEFTPIRQLVVPLLRFVALYSFFDGMAIVFGSAVRGAGDTRFSLIFAFLGAWLIMVLPTVIVARTGGNLAISWWACTIYVIVMGIGFMIRFQHGKWKSMRVIETSPGHKPPAAEWLNEHDAFANANPYEQTVMLPASDSRPDAAARKSASVASGSGSQPAPSLGDPGITLHETP